MKRNVITFHSKMTIVFSFQISIWFLYFYLFKSGRLTYPKWNLLRPVSDLWKTVKCMKLRPIAKQHIVQYYRAAQKKMTFWAGGSMFLHVTKPRALGKIRGYADFGIFCSVSFFTTTLTSCCTSICLFAGTSIKFLNCPLSSVSQAFGWGNQEFRISWAERRRRRWGRIISAGGVDGDKSWWGVSLGPLLNI